MDPKTADKFQVDEPHKYVVVDVTKSNYAAKLPAPIYFRRCEGGALTYVDLSSERITGVADQLLDRLIQEAKGGRYFSRRDLTYEEQAKPITDAIKDKVTGFKRVRD